MTCFGNESKNNTPVEACVEDIQQEFSLPADDSMSSSMVKDFSRGETPLLSSMLCILSEVMGLIGHGDLGGNLNPPPTGVGTSCIV